MDGPKIRRTTRPIIALLLTALTASVFTAVSGPHPGADASLSGKLVPQDATFFGAYVAPTGGWGRTQVQRAITTRENQLGRRFDLSQEYYGWGKSFPTWRQEWDVANGRIPLIAWAAAKSSAVNSGEFDNYIRARADAVRKLGAPVFLRWFSEMDGDYQADKAVSPTAFIAAWRKIQRIFENRGATNVVWVWCPTSWGFETGKAQPFYPGDAHVDWICADGFNWAPKRPGSTWRSFESVFQAFYDFGTARGKPLMVGETGTEEDPLSPGRKAGWVRAAQNAIKSRMRAIKAFVYFDIKRTHDSEGITYDWRMDTSHGSLQAFADMGRDPYFKWNRVYRPDAHLKSGKRSVGQDVYGSRQTAIHRLRGKSRARFTIRVENDGNIGDVFTIEQRRKGKRLRTRYRIGKEDVTAAVRNGGLLTTELGPGEGVTLKLKIRVPRGRIGKAVEILVTSGSDKKVQDVVTAKLRRGKRRR